MAKERPPYYHYDEEDLTPSRVPVLLTCKHRAMAYPEEHARYCGTCCRTRVVVSVLSRTRLVEEELPDEPPF